MRPLAGVLQLGLLEFEQLAFFFAEVFREIVGDIGPLENLPAIDDLLIAILNEHDLRQRKFLHRMQIPHPLLRFSLLPLGNLLGKEMILVPLITKQVAHRIILRLLQDLVLRRVRHLVVAVVAAVSGPVAEAEPAELVSADFAGHVVAAVVLFDWGAALRTWLGEGFNVSNVCILILLLE